MLLTSARKNPGDLGVVRGEGRVRGGGLGGNVMPYRVWLPKLPFSPSRLISDL